MKTDDVRKKQRNENDPLSIDVVSKLLVFFTVKN